MKNVWKRTLSLFLAIVMILGNVPVSALATDGVDSAECGHVNAAVADFQDATCGADGAAQYACADCGAEWEEIIPATGMHTYNSTEMDSVIVYTCAVCGGSYEEAKSAEEEPVQEEPVQEEPVQEESVQETPAFFALAPASRATTLSGVAWVNADAGTAPMDLIGVAAKGGIRDAVLRAVNWYDPDDAEKYTVYCTVDGVTLNVASYRDLYNNLDVANKLADEMKDSVSQATTVPFDIKDADGNLIAVADIGFRSFKTLESADISNIVYEAETAPDDLQATVEAKVKSEITVNGLTQAELDGLGQCITYTVNEKTYELPGPGQSDNVYKNVITATVTEGMTGETATISGGTVTLHNSTPEYTVKYYASEADWKDGNVYADESQFKGYPTPTALEPVREYYLFTGWYMVDEAGKISESAGVAETVSRDTVYVAKWQAEQDKHTPGDVANNDVADGIDDREQTFVVTYYDSADVASRKVLLTKEVSYDGYLTHPTKAEVEEANIAKDGYAFKQWKHLAGQKGFIIKSNAAYVIEWKPVWTITYTGGYDGVVYEDLTKVLDTNAVIRHPAAPERDGWKFVEWKYTGEGDEPATATANATFEAVWTKLHTVKFVDGEATIQEEILEHGAEIVRPAMADKPTHVFGGWELVSGTSTDKAVDDTVYKAVWIDLHTVKFMDGEAAIEEKKLEHGAKIVCPAVQDTTTHVFGGWELVEGASAETAETDTVLKVIWLQRFTITYTDGVEGEEVFADFPREAIEGRTIIHPIVPKQRENYVFTGWKAAEGSDGSLTATGDATFEATWKKKDEATVVYTITYTDGQNGALFATFSVEAVEGSAISHPEVPAVLKNHIFDCWVVTEGTDSGTAAGNVTYKPQWTKLINVKFVDGETLIREYNLEPGAKIERPEALADTDAKIFNGWERVSGNSIDTAVNDTVYKAAWKKLHTIIYTDGVEDEIVFDDITKKVPDGDLIRHPAVQRDGYAFDAWVLESSETAEPGVYADGDRTYKATWKKYITLTYTDGVEDAVVFADFTKKVKEGDDIKHPVVPADREEFIFVEWKKVDDTTYKAVWKQVQITITYVHPQPDGSERIDKSHLESAKDGESVSDTTYVAPEDSDKDKKIYVGLYPVVMHEGERCLKLVYKAVARSADRIVHVPVEDIYEYAQKNKLPDPVDPTTEEFTESVELYHLELPDVDNNGILDGQYVLDPATGTVPKDEAGNDILEFEDKAVSTTYKYYTRNNSYVNEVPDYGQNGYNEEKALNPVGIVYPDYANDGIKFVKWVLDREEVGTYVSTYYMKGQVEDDTNNNAVYDVNENVSVEINVNDAVKPNVYEDFAKGVISITLSSPVVGKKAPTLSNSTFVLDSVNGTNIEINVDAAAGYSIRSVEVEPADDFKAPELKDITSGDDASMKKFTLKETKENASAPDTSSTMEYTVYIALDKLETKESDLVFDPAKPLPEFTVQKVYESVISYPKFDSNKQTAISYVAREADEDVPVSIEPLFQWIKDNYGSYGETMVSTIDQYLDKILDEAGMSGLVTVDGNVHYFHVNLESVPKNVGETVSTPVKSAQDIANSHINAYINKLVALMKTSSGDTTALEDHIAELPIMLSDIQTEANDFAMIRPFGYNAKGEDVFYESVTVTVDGEPLYTGKAAITDKRAVTNLNNGAALSVKYGADANAELAGKAGVAGVHLPVSYNGQVATTYPAGVAFYGSQTMRPAHATMSLTIDRQTANVQVPAKVVKEHNSSYEGQSPDPIVLVGGTAVSNVDVISVIAGVDLTNMDIDLQKSLDNMVTVKNIDPVAWIKLPGNLLTHVALVKKLDVDTSEFVNKMLEGKNLPAADVAKINDLLNQFLNKNQVTCTLDEAIHLLEVFLPDGIGHRDTIQKALNAIKGTAEGNVKVTFSGGYPEDPGVFLNMGIVADSNYVHGISKDTNGKDFGLILNGPVLTMYNNGIQLVSDELPGVLHNVYTFDNDGETHALKVEGHEDAEIFYYGFNSGLAVHYEGDGKTPPARAGMYLVSAYVHDETSGKYMSDMAIMLIGVERTSTTVKGATVEYDGNKHKLEVITVDEEGDNVGRTIIAGTIDKPANAGLRDLRGLVNVDFPETIDNLWTSAVSYLEEKYSIDLPNNIQNAELTPEQTAEFLKYCKTKIESKEFDGILGKVHTGLELALDSLISAMNEIIVHTNGKVVTIQFKDDIGFDRHGVYLYHAIVTDLVYIPSADSGILIIHAPEEDFQMDNQEVPYNGKEQLPEIHDATGREQFLVIYNKNTLSFILGQDGNALLNKLEALGVKDGITVHDLLEKGVDKISTEIVSGLISAGDALLEKIHKDDSKLYQEAKDKLNAHVAARETQIVAKLESMLNDISEKVDPDTKLYFNKKPVDVGNYQVHAFSFGIAHEEATFKIIPAELTITADSDEIFYGDAVPSDIGVTYEGFVNGEDESVLTGTLVITHAYEQGMQAGEYDITPSGLASENYNITYVPGVLTVNGAELTITANSYEITYGDAAPEMDVTYTGFVNGDTEAVLNGTLKLEHEYVQGKDVGEYTITPSGLTSDKYIISFEPGTLKVVEKQITEEDVALGEALTYDGSLQTQEVVGITDGVTFEVTNNTGTNAGDYTLTVTGTGNYTGTVDLKWTIAQKTLTEVDVVLGETLTYNGSLQTMVVTGVTDDITFEVTGNTGKDAGTYIMTVTGTGNYTGAFSEPWNIDKAALKVTANSYEIICGEAAPAMEATYEGFQGEDTVAALGGALVFAHGYTQDAAAAGEYTITPSGLTSGNYDITFVNGTLTVKKIKATLTALDLTMDEGYEIGELFYVVTDADNVQIPKDQCDFEVTMKVMDGDKDVTEDTKALEGGRTYDIIAEVTESKKFDLTIVNGKLTVVEAPAAKQKVAIYATVNGRDSGVQISVNEPISFDYIARNQDTGEWITFDGEFVNYQVFDENDNLIWTEFMGTNLNQIIKPGKYKVVAVMQENDDYEQVEVEGTEFEIVEEDIEVPEDIVITLRADTIERKVGDSRSIVLSHSIRDTEGKTYSDGELELTVTYQLLDESGNTVYDSTVNTNEELQALLASEGVYTIVPVCGEPVLGEGYDFVKINGRLTISKTGIEIRTLINGKQSESVAAGSDPSLLTFSSNNPVVAGISYGSYVIKDAEGNVVEKLSDALAAPGKYTVAISYTTSEEFDATKYAIKEYAATLNVGSATIYTYLNDSANLAQDVMSSTVVKVTYGQTLGAEFDLDAMIMDYKVTDTNGNAIDGISTIEQAKKVVGTYHIYPVFADSVDTSSFDLVPAVLTVEYVEVDLYILIDNGQVAAAPEFYFGEKQTFDPNVNADRYLQIDAHATVMNPNENNYRREYFDFASKIVVGWTLTDTAGNHFENEPDKALEQIGVYEFKATLAEQQADTWDAAKWDENTNIYDGKYHLNYLTSTLKIKPFKTKPVVYFEEAGGTTSDTKTISFGDGVDAFLSTIIPFAGDVDDKNTGIVETYMVVRMNATTFSLRRTGEPYEIVGYGAEGIQKAAKMGAGTYLLIPVHGTVGNYKTFEEGATIGNYEVDTAEHATLVIEPMKVTIETTSKVQDLKVVSGATAEDVAQYFGAIVKNKDGEEIETTGLLDGFEITDSEGKIVEDTATLAPGTYKATATYTEGNYIVDGDVNSVEFTVIDQKDVTVKMWLSKNEGNYYMYGSDEWNWEVDAEVVATKNGDVVQIPGMTANSYTIAKDGQPYDEEVSINSRPGTYVYTPVIPADYKDIPYDEATFVQGKFRTTVETLINYQSEWKTFIGVNEDEIKFTESYHSGPTERRTLVKEFVIKNASGETVDKSTAMATEGVYTIEVIYNESALGYIEVTDEDFATLTVRDPEDVYVQANVYPGTVLVDTDENELNVYIDGNASIPGMTNNSYMITNETGEKVDSLEDALKTPGVYTFTPVVPDEFKDIITDRRTTTLHVVEMKDLVVTATADPATVTVGGSTTIKVWATYETTMVDVPGLTDNSYTVWNQATGEPVMNSVDEAGNVIETALSKALNKVGTYEIRPIAPDGVKPENVKPATLEVQERRGIINYQTMTLTLDGVTYLNYYMTLNGFDPETDFAKNGGVVIWTNEINAPTKEAQMQVGAVNTKSVPGMWQGQYGWYVKSNEVYAKNLGDLIYMRPYVEVTPGEYVYGPTKIYSPELYCRDQIKRVDLADKVKAVCAALLEYGASAQKYFDEELDKLVNRNIDLSAYDLTFSENLIDPLKDLTLEKDGAKIATLEGEKLNPGITFNTATLSLEGAIILRVGYNLPASIDVSQIKKAEVLFWTEDAYNSAQTLAYSAGTYSYKEELKWGAIGDKQCYVAGSDYIVAKALSDTIYFSVRVEMNDGTVYKGGINWYSPEMYVKDQLNTSDAELLAVVKAIVVYSEKARICFLQNG